MARRRGYEQVRDMALSLGLVIVFVMVTVAFLGGSLGILREDPAARDVRPVDYREELRTAVQEADYEVLAPSGVPDGWVSQSARAVSAEDPTASVELQIGFLTPDSRYATVVQTDDDLPDVLEGRRLGDEAEATVDVAGRAWQQHRRLDRDEVALVRTEGSRTVVVTGDARAEDLVTLAAGLRPADEVPEGAPVGTDGFQPID